MFSLGSHQRGLTAFVILLFTFLTFSAKADIMYCNAQSNGDGVSNLNDSSGCYVLKNNEFPAWDGWRVDLNTVGGYSFTADQGDQNDNRESVSNVISFLADFGFDDDGSMTDYYADDGTPVGSIWLLGKSDDNTPYGGVTSDTANSGGWDLPGEDLATFVTVKSGDGFFLFFLEGGAGSGTWATETSEGAMSHISFWGADPGFGILCIDCCEDGDDCEPVPEPNVLVLLSLTLFGVVIYNRRKWLKQ